MRNISDRAYECYDEKTRYIKSRLSFYKSDKYDIDSADVKEWTVIEAITNDDNFAFGGACSSQLTIKLYNPNNKYDGILRNGIKIVPEIGIQIGEENIEWTEIGVFTISEVEKDEGSMSVECFDNMNTLCQQAYKCNLSFPCKLEDLLNDCCNQVGINRQDVPQLFNNHAMILYGNPFGGEEDISCRAVLECIAQETGGWAIMNKRGHIEFCRPTNTGLTLTRDKYTKMKIGQGVYIEKIEVDNGFLPKQEFLFKHTVSPMEGSYYGNIGISCGDIIHVVDRENIKHETIITKQTIKFKGGLSIDIEASALNTTQEQSKVKTETERLNDKIDAKYNILEGRLDNTATLDELQQKLIENSEEWGLAINGKMSTDNYVLDGETVNIFNNKLNVYTGATDTTTPSIYNDNGIMAYMGRLITCYNNSESGGINTELIDNTITVNQYIKSGNKLNIGYTDGNNMTNCISIGSTGTTLINGKNIGIMKDLAYVSTRPYFYNNNTLIGYVDYSSDNKLLINTAKGFEAQIGGTSYLKVTTSGITVNGTVSNTSDAIYKSDIKEYEEDVIDKLMNTKVYKYTKNNREEIGFVAQEMEEVKELLVGQPTDYTIDKANNEPLDVRPNVEGASVDLYSTIGMLWKICQEQQKKIEELEQIIKKGR